MAFLDDLARRFAETHSTEATALLETMAPAEVTAFLAELSPAVAAELVSQSVSQLAVPACTLLDADRAGEILTRMPLALAAGTLRRLESGPRERVLRTMDEEIRNVLGTMLEFPPRTAGALMDPRALALPETITAEEAVRRIRGMPQNLLYNIYVVNREHVLVGVLNLRELLLANSADSLRTLMNPCTLTAAVTASAMAIVSHPGWRETHSLPVVDEDGLFLGAIRYSMLRRLEHELAGRDEDPASTTVQALGDLFWTGVGGLITAAASSVSPRQRRGSGS